MNTGIPASDLGKINELLKDSEFHDCVKVDGNTLWLRYDIDDCDPKEQWTEYCDVQERLRTFGLELGDPCVEHDCISGDLCYKDIEG